MKAFDAIRGGFWRWLDLVAESLVAGLARLRKERTVRVEERERDCFRLCSTDVAAGVHPDNDAIRIEEDGHFAEGPSSQIDAAVRGNRLELQVRSDRFVFKPLELPSRAVEFLGGVVRAQIDRLTPWSPDQAAFGFSAPAEAGPGRIVVTVVATAKSILVPLVTAFSGLGARSVVIRTTLPDMPPDAPAITIMEAHVARALDVSNVRRMLLGGLVCALLITVAAGIAGAIIGGNLQAHQDDLARRIARQRAAMLSASHTAADPRTVAERMLARRKNESPSAVIALDILSQILPDTTYVTEMNIEGNKVRLTGVTHDAPQLIRLMEQTRHFSQATFFAPITTSPSGAGDRFSIEARMEPNFSLTP